jgi:hypothetical protein
MTFFAWISCVLFAISWVSCTKTMSGVVKKSHTHYGVALPPSSWSIKNFRGTDLFFRHNFYDAMIFVNAECQKVSDSPLPAMTAQILAGMGKYEIITQNPIPLAEREGLVSEVNAKLDGVDRYLKILVLRKNRCVFDAALSAREYNPEVVKDFDEMIKTFWAEADL